MQTLELGGLYRDMFDGMACDRPIIIVVGLGRDNPNRSYSTIYVYSDGTTASGYQHCCLSNGYGLEPLPKTESIEHLPEWLRKAVHYVEIPFRIEIGKSYYDRTDHVITVRGQVAGSSPAMYGGGINGENGGVWRIYFADGRACIMNDAGEFVPHRNDKLSLVKEVS